MGFMALEKVRLQHANEQQCLELLGLGVSPDEDLSAESRPAFALNMHAPEFVPGKFSDAAFWENSTTAGSPDVTQPPSDAEESSGEDDLVVVSEDEVGKRPMTTLLLHNVPMVFSAQSLLELLNAEGFKGRLDFCYLPMKFDTGTSLGYAFVNGVTEEDADALEAHLQGFASWGAESAGPCEVERTSGTQGRAANVERYRNSPVMHPEVAEVFKPVLLEHGEVVAFPAPTVAIKVPKRRRTKVAKN